VSRRIVFPLLFPDLVARGAHCFLHTAPGFLSLSLHFLGKAFNLVIFVARPLAHLALRPAGDLVESPIHSVPVHHFLPSGQELFSAMHASLLQEISKPADSLQSLIRICRAISAKTPKLLIMDSLIFLHGNGITCIYCVVFTFSGKDCPALAVPFTHFCAKPLI
jgi:hypothetical protein